MNPKPYESHGAGDPTAVPAALGLALLAVGGWLLTTARPWHKPGHPLTLGLGWTASGALLVCGLVLLARCVRTVHGRPEPARDADAGVAPDADVPAPTEAGTGTDG
ncbi:hypothetical protein BCL76_102125 [Streptomyces sp. CG 926]|uniref:hypothetical protein n=1 Tax=Streptomyces sp. CG 926 TaxID=1882405 RepID=UPI000D6BAF03|nr:hypothetical protein [Streptomyces sp. CG 926]PWK73105.1 hypothetical protein BCL76_102125 [Streptomyces sp. CG 926]